MDLTFGARLRLQRERQAVTLRSIADESKIKISLLEGLERDDLSQWPAGIYRRSYFRVYAQAIGLDPDTSVREFLARYPDPIDDNATGSGAPAGRPPTRLRYLIESAVGVLQPALRPQSPSFDERPADTPAAAPGIAGAEDETQALEVRPADLPLNAEVSSAPAPDVDITAAVGPVPVDFTEVAHLCTSLAGAVEAREIARALERLATILQAVGVILWTWDPQLKLLVAALAHGYAEELLRQLPRVPAESESAIAAAFRTSETLLVDGSDTATGAVVAPLLPPAGCAGVLAIELPAGGEQRHDVRAATIIVAAQLSALLETPALTRAVNA